jgi:RNA-directed DNA polymerase
MTGLFRSNDPVGPSPDDQAGSLVGVVGRGSPVKVRELQCKLWTVAKASPERRFHALYDRVYRGEVLWEAWERVRENRGAAGVDCVTLADVESYGVGRMLGELQEDLRVGRYRPAPVKRRMIPKPGGWRGLMLIDDLLSACQVR